MDFPGGSDSKEPACNAGDLGLIPGLGRSPGGGTPGGGWQPTPAFLPGESHGQRSLEGYSPWGHKESDMTEQLSTHDNIEFQEIYLMLSLENERKENIISKIGAWN